MRRFFVFLIVAVLAVSGCTVAGTPVRTPPTVPPVAEQTVELDPAADTEIAVSAGWTITVPAHAAPPGADCTPSCAGGTITSKVLRWNGRTYS